MAADLKFPSAVNQLNALPDAKKVFTRLSEVPIVKCCSKQSFGTSVTKTVNVTWCKASMERILIVDDEADCQTVLAMYLESQGYQVECAYSGVEALSIFENDPQI